MAPPTTPTPDRWRRALEARASPRGLELLGELGDAGVVRRFLGVTVSEGSHTTRAWLAGKRAKFRPGLHRLVGAAVGEDQAVLVRWIMGRWPRGLLTVAVPLTPDFVRTLDLGIIAPLQATRIALSESPVPFPIPSVKHFKALHEETGTRGLVGCRLHVEDEEAESVVGRWPIEPERLPHIARTWELEDIARDLALPAISGLTEGVRGASTTLEAAYTPEPRRGFVVEVGPTPVARVLGLIRAALGEDRAHPVVEAARDLRQKVAWRARLALDADGLQHVAVLLGPKDQPFEWKW